MINRCFARDGHGFELLRKATGYLAAATACLITSVLLAIACGLAFTNVVEF